MMLLSEILEPSSVNTSVHFEDFLVRALQTLKKCNKYNCMTLTFIRKETAEKKYCCFY